MSLWPFPPINEVVEVLEWKTDVLRARASEQRFRLRERPRRQWHFKHMFNAEQQSAARAIVRGATSYKVPDWIRQIYGGSVSAGSSVSLSMTTAGYGLAAGQSVVLFNGIDDYEVCTVESVSPSALVLEFVAIARVSTRIYRLDNATASVNLSITRYPWPIKQADISFESPAVDIHAESTYAQYRGHDVMPSIPVFVGSMSLSENVEWQIETFDNATGLVSTVRQRDLPDDNFMIRWQVFTPAEILAVRAWIASRYGRWLAFWQSTWERDFIAAADLSSGSTTLRVFSPSGVSSLGRTSFDLEIGTPSGVFMRRVTAVSTGPAVSGNPTFDLTIDSALGVAVTAAAFGRISFLRCARFNADRIEIQHRPGEGLAVAIPCIEVPVT